MLQEIERKFIIDNLPSLAELNVIEIQNINQIYLATGQEQIRARKLVRNNQEKYTLTLKRGHGLLRDEIESIISKDTYNQLSREFIPLIKMRYVILTQGVRVYVDEYYQHRLTIAEVEFPSKLEARQFEPLSWFSVEVTGIQKYENQYLWQVLQKAKHN
jgi:adenylate cyclase